MPPPGCGACARARARPGSRWAKAPRALRRAGVSGVLAPTRMDSEGVLALPALASLRGRQVALVTAPGGRGLIAPTLAARGAQVLRADVYERVPAAPAPQALARLRGLRAAVPGPGRRRGAAAPARGPARRPGSAPAPGAGARGQRPAGRDRARGRLRRRGGGRRCAATVAAGRGRARAHST